LYRRAIPFSFLFSLLGFILNKFHYWNRNDTKFIQLSTHALSIDAAQRKSVPISGTTLLGLTFALWFSRFIGSHQFLQGNLVTIVITSLLAKSYLSAPNLHGTPPPCYTSIFSTRDYTILIFTCLLSLQSLRGKKRRRKITWAAHRSFRSAMQFIFGFNPFWSQPDLSHKAELYGKSHLGH
jgi:hypothetical protein